MAARPWLAIAILAVTACSDDRTAASAAPAADAGLRDSGLPQTCARAPSSAPPPSTCNGAAELCDRTYDRAAVPMTHNAMSNADDGWGSPNQTHGIERQLADGVRGMMLDLHYYDTEEKRTEPERTAEATPVDQIYLCHQLCQIGKRRALDAFCAIGDFLDRNPGEVLSIIFETYVTDDDLAAALVASGLAEYAYAHPAGTPWPTLRALIDSNERLVLFVEKGGGDPPYLHPAFTGNIRDTPYSFEQQADFSCAPNRGQDGDPLFLINHWLGRPLAKIDYAREVNVEAVLGARVEKCTKEVGRPPTFVGVDFYEVGDLFPVVRKVNGL